MLIHLGKPVLDRLSTDLSNSDDAVQAVQNIAQARAQGDHIVSLAESLREDVLHHPRLSATTRGVLRRIDEEQTQVGALHRKLAIFVNVTPPANPDVVKTNEGTQMVLHIALTRFQRNDICQPVFLIGENLTDCELFLLYTSWFARNYWRGRIPDQLKAVTVPGGGDTTDRVLGTFSNDRRYLTLCITDSDIEHPLGSVGQTARKCESVKLTETCYHHTLATRSAENLLCFAQIEQILSVEREREPLLLRLQRLAHLSGREAWKFLPLKDGVKQLHGPVHRNSSLVYWIVNCDATHGGGNDEYLHPPLSSKLLRWAVEHFRDQEPVDISNDAQLFQIWERLALLVASWACAPLPMRS